MRPNWKRSIWLAPGIDPPPPQLAQPPGKLPTPSGPLSSTAENPWLCDISTASGEVLA